ncbi:hypothetical protein JTE90_000204 [Oedothorax gibbosus]|uniref:Uncharacterized protein n=1 Tax=Oedothorax gibbosus TaxID=931172 RepID=A0AAV6VAD5_9ARAC|nr:hypothetical protein JTE90_000204 [Oedothorax gibbosus]
MLMIPFDEVNVISMEMRVGRLGMRDRERREPVLKRTARAMAGESTDAAARILREKEGQSADDFNLYLH